MNLLEALSPIPEKSVVSIVGGGGKTATLFSLGRLLKGRSVLITTTTKIMRPGDSPDYRIVSDPSELRSSSEHIPFVYGIARPEYPGKLTGCSFSFLDEMTERFDYLLVESDGSAGRPVKAPKDHEPVVFPGTGIYIGLIGLDCLGKKGDDSTVHRPGRFSTIREKNEEQAITAEDLVKLINHREGLFKNAPENCRKIIILNKADLLEYSEGKALADLICGNLSFPGTVILNSYKKKDSVLFTTKKE